jgi:hypothetical protein
MDGVLGLDKRCVSSVFSSSSSILFTCISFSHASLPIIHCSICHDKYHINPKTPQSPHLHRPIFSPSHPHSPALELPLSPRQPLAPLPRPPTFHFQYFWNSRHAPVRNPWKPEPSFPGYGLSRPCPQCP